MLLCHLACLTSLKTTARQVPKICIASSAEKKVSAVWYAIVGEPAGNGWLYPEVQEFRSCRSSGVAGVRKECHAAAKERFR